MYKLNLHQDTISQHQFGKTRNFDYILFWLDGGETDTLHTLKGRMY